MKQIVFSTLRDNKGATGGPGGVLFMLKEVIGENINSHILCKYEFNVIRNNFIGAKIINKLFFLVKALFRKDSFYVVHDIESAHLLAFLKRKYALIYHNQGPIVQEFLNFGAKLSRKDIKKIQRKERLAFINANSLHFPSIGAANMYFSNEFRSCERNETNLGLPLYNTIPNSSIKGMEHIKRDKNILTFFSLGTLTSAKGQDLSLKFIEEYLNSSKLSIRYILVGNGPLKDDLITNLNRLSSQFENFHYYYYPKLSHSEVMYLHTISDIYIMLHRLSIFDFATLEAMSQGTAILLSPIGGNMDFNKESNILYITDNYKEGIHKLLNSNIDLLKEKNKHVFETYFSKAAFKNEYIKMIDLNS